MTFAQTDSDAFRTFEQEGWERIPAQYHDSFGHLTVQAVDPLLDAAAVRPGTRVLDVATGPGYVAGAAARRGAAAVGIDFATAMLEAARDRHPAVDFQQGDAEALTFADESFDAVVMSFGLLHLARPERALAEAYRVLRAGGKIGFTVWAQPQDAIGFDFILRAVQCHGTLDVALPPAPPFFRFSDAEECRRVLRGAGFAAPEVTQVPQTWWLHSADAFFDIMQASTVRTAGLLRAQRPGALSAIRDEVRRSVEARRTKGGVELPMPAVLASAVKL